MGTFLGGDGSKNAPSQGKKHIDVPFNKETELLSELGPYLPGHPRVNLQDFKQLNSFLRQEFDLRDLALMASKLWMMSQHTHENISALHRQKVKRRELCVAEDIKLHLLWYYDRVYIKPLPKFLLSYIFWQQYLLNEGSPLAERRSIQKVALGYIRTYFYLIRHESDFRLATHKDLQLIPPSVSWEDWCLFSSRFDLIDTDDVAERYQYGEIRLSRLNFYAKLFLGKRSFQRIHAQYSAYFAAYYGPLLFIFATLSVALSAFQLELTAEQLFNNDVPSSRQWEGIWKASRYISVLFLSFVGFSTIFLAYLFGSKLWNEWAYALKDRHAQKRRKARQDEP